jgi:hypothetical protein
MGRHCAQDSGMRVESAIEPLDMPRYVGRAVGDKPLPPSRAGPCMGVACRAGGWTGRRLSITAANVRSRLGIALEDGKPS